MSKGLLALIEFVHVATGEILKRYKDVETPPTTTEPVELPEEDTGTPLERLVRAQKLSTTTPPALKAVTLAQWLLESGRGTSKLSTEHFNFGGLKWRPEMEGYATPVKYLAHDGPDTYCKFTSPAAYIEGYWKFIGRSPYRGWEAHKGSGEAYIMFIASKGYAEGAKYVAKILALVPEAQALLGETPTKPKGSGRLAVVVGHSRAADGAQGVSPLSQGEYAYNSDIAKRMKAYGEKMGLEVDIFTRDRGGVSGAYDLVEAMSPHAAIELHFNASSGSSARGTEVLYSDDRDRAGVGELAFAKVCLAQMERVFNRTGKERYKPLLELSSTDKGRGYYNITQVFSFPSVIVEPFFGSNRADATLGHTKRQEYAQCLVDAFIEWKVS